MNYSIEIALKYEKRGVIATTHCNENYLQTVNDIQAVEDYGRDDLLKAVKKAISAISNDDKYFSGEFNLNVMRDYSHGYSVCCIYRDYKDRENDTYTIYRYEKFYGGNDTEVVKVSKKALVNELTRNIDKLIDEYKTNNQL